MKTHIIRIGNSQGVRIPKPLLEQANLGQEVEIEVQDNQILIRPAKDHPREGWADSFRMMAERQDDQMLDHEASAPTRWDEQEWKW